MNTTYKATGPLDWANVNPYPHTDDLAGYWNAGYNDGRREAQDDSSED